MSQLDILDDTAEQLQRTLAELEGLTPDERDGLASRWPANLQALFELTRATLAERQVGAAEGHAEAIAHAIGLFLGGRDFYIPTGDSLKKALTHIAIWRAYNGRNLYHLAKRYGLTERRVAQIIAEQRQVEVARRQQKLF